MQCLEDLHLKCLLLQIFKNALLKFSAFSQFSTRIASPHCIAGMLEHLVLPINCLAMCHNDLGFVLMPLMKAELKGFISFSYT